MRNSKPACETENAYSDAFKIGRACGKTDREIWERIHEIMDKHGIDWREEERKVLKGYYRTVSQKTRNAVSEWMMHNKVTRKRMASICNVGVDFITSFQKGKKMNTTKSAYRNLRDFCIKHNLLWEERIWDEEDSSYRIVSKETVNAFFELIRNSGISKNQLAVQENFDRTVYNKLNQGKRIQANRKEYKVIKKLCENNSIVWKDEVWEEKE